MIFQQKLPDIHNNKETSKNVIFGEKTVKFFLLEYSVAIEYSMMSEIFFQITN